MNLQLIQLGGAVSAAEISLVAASSVSFNCYPI